MKFKLLLHSALAGAILALAACDSKEPGEDSVATINGYEVTLAELNHELAQSGIQDADDPAARQAALQAIINRRLLAEMALGNELDRTPDFVLQEQRMRDVLLAEAAVQSLAPQGSRASQNDVEAFLQTNLNAGRERTVYAVDGLQFPRPRKVEVMDRLAAAESFEEIVRILRDADIEPRAARLTWDSASMPTDFVRQLNGLSEGEPFLIPEGGAVVAGVIRETRRLPLEPEQSRMLAEAAVSQQTVQARVSNWLEQARHSAEIRYGEGFEPAAGSPGTAPAKAPSATPTGEPDRT